MLELLSQCWEAETNESLALPVYPNPRISGPREKPCINKWRLVRWLSGWRKVLVANTDDLHLIPEIHCQERTSSLKLSSDLHFVLWDTGPHITKTLSCSLNQMPPSPIASGIWTLSSQLVLFGELRSCCFRGSIAQGNWKTRAISSVSFLLPTWD